MVDEDKGADRWVRLNELYTSVAKAIDAANEELEKAGEGTISYAVVESEITIPFRSISTEKGLVRLRLPEADTDTQGFKEVRFKIRPLPRAESREPAPKLTVPSVVGEDVQKAADVLSQHGFRVGKLTFDKSGKPSGSVLSQEPKSGVHAESGAAVSLKVAGDSIDLNISAEAIEPR
jgi:beta-lactam-binding protein with PASTA domain